VSTAVRTPSAARAFPSSSSSSRRPSLALVAAATAGAVLAAPSLARAAPGWSHWWLPHDYSTHGHGIDSLFLWTFWITTITFVLVQGTLIVFLIKYRSRRDRSKATFTHGNTRLEMAWTLAPALILAGLAVANKGIWDEYRFNPGLDDPNRAKILVVGQQFKWNIVYPGPDGELGRYLLFPKPTDLKWPDGKPHQGVDGPAQLPYAQAQKAINTYIDQENPLGKDFSDPAGADDDWQKALAREMAVPVDRPVEVQLSSKDVIHSFFLPNFRAKLDAVPGMRGRIHFTATKTSKKLEEETTRSRPVDEVIRQLESGEIRELTIRITEADKENGAEYDTRARQWLYKEKEGKKATIVRDSRALNLEVAKKLKENGVNRVTAYAPGYWEIVCEELCGQGHNTMRGQLVVLSQEEYARQFEGKTGTTAPPPSTRPSVTRAD
jgi:heme/copper-type cytochrome/quinol oxidase subunit 2